jgi:hypothetical protein
MRQVPKLLALASLSALCACNGATGSQGSGNAASTSTSTVKNTTTPADGGTLASTRPLRCAPSTGMLDACSGKAVGDACSLSSKHDGGFSVPGSCRATFDGAGVACVPNFPGPPSFLVDACTGKAADVSCSATGPAGRSFQGMCITARQSGTLFCGREHTPPLGLLDACSGKSAGEACTRPEHRDGGSKPGVCRAGPAGGSALSCRPASSPGVLACTGQDAGASCTLGFGHKESGGPAGSCVTPAAGGPASCVVSCEDLFHHRHHHRHGFGGGPFQWGGSHGGPFWHHGADAGAPAP